MKEDTKEKQTKAYNDWYVSPSKQNMSNIIKSLDKLVNSEVMRYGGTLSRPTLKSFAKKYVADAVRSFNPKSGVHLSTHVVNNLQRLHRLNYKAVQGLKSSENVQSRMNEYLRSIQDLYDIKGKEPTIDEIATYMQVDPRFIINMQKQMKFEQGPSDQAMDIMHTETSPEEEALDYVYHDLPPIYKKILEYKTGYGGTPILSGIDIANKLNLSPVRVSQISDVISGKLKGHLGYGI